MLKDELKITMNGDKPKALSSLAMERCHQVYKKEAFFLFEWSNLFAVSSPLTLLCIHKEFHSSIFDILRGAANGSIVRRYK